MAAVEENTIIRPGVDEAQAGSVLSKLPKTISRRGKSGEFGYAPKILEWLLLILLALLSARLFWLILAPIPIADTPTPIVRQVPSSNDAILARSPFTPMAEDAQPVAIKPKQEDVQETTLDLKLHGAWSAGEDSGAIISTKNGKQKAFQIGDEITNNVTLKAVYPNYVTINSNGIVESLKLPKDIEINTAAPARAAQPVIASTNGVSESTIGDVESSVSSLLNIARFDTMLDSEGEQAIAIVATGDIAPLEALGLRDRDIIRAINNRRINDLGDVLPRLVGQDSVRIVVERNGVPVEVMIDMNQGKSIQ